MPSPLPIRRQFSLSLCVACVNRGYQAKGKVIVLLSLRSAIRLSSVKETLSINDLLVNDLIIEFTFVMPAKAGIQSLFNWFPAFAGKTAKDGTVSDVNIIAKIFLGEDKKLSGSAIQQVRRYLVL